MPDNLTPPDMPDPPDLPSKQARAVRVLLLAPDVAAAAAELEISRDTLHRWLREPAFRAQLHEAESHALEAVTRRLVLLADTAASTLESAMTDEETGTAVRVRAAGIVLGRLLQLRQLADLESRISSLESAQANGGGA